MSYFFTWVVAISMIVGIIGFIVGLLVTIYTAFKRNPVWKKWIIVTFIGLCLYVWAAFKWIS